jgi:glycosyltransferase involved in cell wall biosynthesis
MRILMIAPHPVYTPRGTPISVLNRCRALSALGHEIDLVTYPIGEDVPVAGLHYIRAQVPGISHVAIGPSWRKIPLNLSVFLVAAWRMLRHRRRYDLLHTHEEAGVLVFLGKAVGLRHVYDMGNDLGVVLRNYGLTEKHPVTRLATALEKAVVRKSDVVIVHFPELAQTVSSWSSTPSEVIHNTAVDGAVVEVEHRDRFAREWAPNGEPLVVYTGTFEPYQGLESLVEALPLLDEKRSRLVLAGGTVAQQNGIRDLAERLGVADRVILPGILPQDEIPSCLDVATVLVSPRGSGTNTPLKVFSYLASGKPVLATKIVSHTQVLDDSTAHLVEATPEGLASGMSVLLADSVLRRRLANAGSALAASRFSEDEFVAGVGRAYQHVVAESPS